MALYLLLAVQLVAMVVGFALLWRRLDRLGGEVSRLHTLLEAQRAQPQRRTKRAAAGGVAQPVIETEVIHSPAEPPLARAARAWNLSRRESAPRQRSLRTPTLTPETGRGLVLALMAIAPAIGFFFNGDQPAIVASGLAIAAAMLVVALRPMWRTAAWAGVLTAAAWAALGFALSSAHAEPVSYSFGLALAAVTALVHAHMRRAAPGLTMAFAMSVAALALGSQIGMAGAAGVAFATIVAAAAIVGALSLRLEALHLASFAAAVLGLFVLSGQHGAAIWFTPAATWAGALYLAIAIVRVPQLGARGVAIAGTGAFAPLGAIAALYGAQHGLADKFAAAAAFVGLAAVLGAIITLSALRYARTLMALRLTLWVLALGAGLAVFGAIVLAAPAPAAAAAFAAVGLALAGVDARFANRVWRAFAAIAGVLAALYGAVSAELVLREEMAWPAWGAIGVGLAAPALLSAGAAYVAGRNKTAFTAGLYEAIAILLGVAGLSMMVRFFFAGGAPMLQGIGFVEIGLHAVAWLAAALVIGVRAEHGARAVRLSAMNLFLFMALMTMAIASGLWAASYWLEHLSAAPAWLGRDTLGFLFPSLLFWAHWTFWRERGDHMQTRLSLAAASLLLAAFVTVEATRVEDWAPWIGASIGALSFGLAVVINFAPGVTNEASLLPATLRRKFPSKAAPPSAP